MASSCGDASGGPGTGGDTGGTTTTTTTASGASTGTSPTTTTGSGTGAVTSTDAQGSSSGGEGPETVTVGHAREFRAVWVATVFNINFPSTQGLSAEAQQDELRELLDVVRATGLNAVVFQVRPECDALYASELEPWSRYLTGKQGQDPGYDPLAFVIAEGHARGIEVHAWLNPYRARASKGAALDPLHPAAKFPQYAYDYGNNTWMDPGAKAVQDHTLAVIADIVTRYDVDGIHFDDYFYPYPTDAEFPDDTTWQAYQESGGMLSRADWRRSNVDGMVQAVGTKIAEIKPTVRFGISPFGIYRPGTPPGITGFDQYEGLYADPLKWLQEGWLDYLAPQLYWPIGQEQQSYATLIEWWASVAEERYIFAGNYLSKLGSEPVWSVDEFRQQLILTREQGPFGALGNIFFHVGPIKTNLEGVADVFHGEFYAAPALTPPLAGASEKVEPPAVTKGEGVVMLSHPEAAAMRAWVVYAQNGDGWTLDRIVPAEQTSVDLAPGTWAISAAGRSGVESAGVPVTLP